ncbi:probable ATP-dependent RNA helicase DDX28 [Uloborus diversus]|uniref:probable ATP-dependent RNA helicase DDX28 n=1 Tax=Uloborus diversus TaxID=327109 RepID=UPI00240999D1|nr:probable ATP-dependent RNA helicase DDX28 [Uloborus diversus]
MSCPKYLKTLKRLYSSQSTQCIPVIKLPVYVKQQAKKNKIKDLNKERLLKRRIIYRGNTSIPVISSTEKENNYYLGQVYNEKYPIPLQSKWWYRTNCSGQKFTINPWDSNPSLPMVPKVDDVEALFPTHFSQLLSNRNILKQLQEGGMEYPTGIQVLTMPKILDNKHVLFASETGSGKTIAYLAPVLERLAAIKGEGKRNEYPDTPLALILVPGKELALQIGLVAQNLSKHSKLAIKVLVSDGVEVQELVPYDNSYMDVLVASIGTFKILFKKGVFKLANLEYLVLDEADTLLDDTFIQDTSYILQHVSV